MRPDAALTKAIIAMAQSLKLNVTAEGVDAEDQVVFLRLQQCGEVQGYLFCLVHLYLRRNLQSYT